MSEIPGASVAPPNWYQDPGNPQFLRYWDGLQWTQHTAPAPLPGAAGGYPAQQAPRTGGSNKAMWALVIVVGIPALLVVIGILAAIAIPVFLNQREKAEDASAKADVSTLGKEIATWYVDHEGGPPAVTVSGGEYSVDHVVVGEVSANVELGGITGTGATDWCVWVTNPQGDLKDYQYSASGGPEPGICWP